MDTRHSQSGQIYACYDISTSGKKEKRMPIKDTSGFVLLKPEGTMGVTTEMTIF
jgi:hypothetical protein